MSSDEKRNYVSICGQRPFCRQKSHFKETKSVTFFTFKDQDIKHFKIVKRMEFSTIHFSSYCQVPRIKILYFVISSSLSSPFHWKIWHYLTDSPISWHDMNFFNLITKKELFLQSIRKIFSILTKLCISQFELNYLFVFVKKTLTFLCCSLMTT